MTSTPSHADTSPSTLQWRKSAYCGGMTSCVELAGLAEGHVAMRNSSDPNSPVLIFSRAEFSDGLKGIKAGEFDDLAA